MNQFGVSCGSIKELLEKKPYYNIACAVLAAEGQPQHLLHFYGERNGFIELKQVMDFCNFLRNVDRSTYPIAINHQFEILRPHAQIAASILNGYSDFFYMACQDQSADLGESWLGDYPQKEVVIQRYKDIISAI